METIIFLIIWIGGASLHTLLELNSKKSRSNDLLGKGENAEKSVRFRNEW